MNPRRAASLASAGIASSRLPSTTSTWSMSSGTFKRIFSICGGTKWIMRSSLFGNTSTQVLIPALASRPPYDPLKDFVGIYLLCNSPNSIVVHESVPARTLAELIAYAKANQGKLSYGSAGVGTMTNLTGELFKQLIGAPDIVHIPYKGAAPGVTDLASGHIPMMTPNVGGTLIDLHRAGKVRILAVTSRRRLQVAPDIPTAIEAGLPGMVAEN